MRIASMLLRRPLAVAFIAGAVVAAALLAAMLAAAPRLANTPVASTFGLSVAHAAEPRRWWLGDWVDGYGSGRCVVRAEARRGQFHREIACPGGTDARWGGEWNAEYRDGPCYVRQIATRESLVEDVECSPQR